MNYCSCQIWGRPGKITCKIFSVFLIPYSCEIHLNKSISSQEQSICIGALFNYKILSLNHFFSILLYTTVNFIHLKEGIFITHGMDEINIMMWSIDLLRTLIYFLSDFPIYCLTVKLNSYHQKGYDRATEAPHFSLTQRSTNYANSKCTKQIENNFKKHQKDSTIITNIFENFLKILK